MKIKGYIEITEKEYSKLPLGVGAYCYNCETNEETYFKKEQEFPKVFEDGIYKFRVNEFGDLSFEFDHKKFYLSTETSFPILKQAVEFADKIRSEK